MGVSRQRYEELGSLRQGLVSSEESGLVAAPVPLQGSVVPQSQKPPPRPVLHPPEGARAPTSNHTTICSHSNTKTAQTSESTEMVSPAHGSPAPVTSLRCHYPLQWQHQTQTCLQREVKYVLLHCWQPACHWSSYIITNFWSKIDARNYCALCLKWCFSFTRAGRQKPTLTPF